MKKHTIKKHLAPYSILQKRMTTINHAFASAIAPVDKYNEADIIAAIRILGQDPEDDLECIYCGSDAQAWDHLIGLVKDSELRGYGHQIGNLVPCCTKCNSKKGSKDWEPYLREKAVDETAFNESYGRISAYLAHYAEPVNLGHAAEALPDEWQRYGEIKQEIFKLMAEADEIAARLRNVVVSKEN